MTIFGIVLDDKNKFKMKLDQDLSLLETRKLIEKKITIKRNVFLYLNPDINLLKGVYPEIDSFLFHSADIVDRLIKMALCRSWYISRLLLFLAKKYSRMRKLCG